MIPRRSSFFISLGVHLVLLSFALFLYNFVTLPKKEKRMPINLCQCVVQSSCTCKSQEEPAVQKVIQNPPKQEVKKLPPPKQVFESVKKEIAPQNTVQKEIVQPSTNPSVQNSTVIAPTPDKTLLLQPVVQESKTLQSIEHKTQVPKPSVQKQYVQTNLSAIRTILQENFYYPLSARKRGIQGEVVVKFTLLKNSTIKDIIITKSSQGILDSAAQKTIEALDGKLPAPSEDLVLELPINYRLH
ncbi:MAG: TonB family protein [Thiovulaceae bacterium]|nr:TonB family protein [Sulfurimonadaceae bacterium]